MSERLYIADVALDQVTVDNVVYTYPAERVPHSHIALAMGLSSSYVDGEIIPLEVDPEEYPDQGSYFIAAEPKDEAFMKTMGNMIDGRFGAMVDNIRQDPRKVATLTRIGEHLEAGGTVVHAVPHGPLMDIGMMHTLMYLGLSGVGARFRAGAMISQGINGLGKDFNGYTVPLSKAFSWPNHKVWYVTPRTENAENSEFAQVVPAAQIDQQNRVVRADVIDEQKLGGMFITAALSATGYQIGDDGVRRLMAPTLGTLRTFDQPRTQVCVAFGEILDSAVPVYDLSSKLWRLEGDEQALTNQGNAIMEDMTDGLNRVVVGKHHMYVPRSAEV